MGADISLIADIVFNKGQTAEDKIEDLKEYLRLTEEE